MSNIYKFPQGAERAAVERKVKTVKFKRSLRKAFPLVKRASISIAKFFTVIIGGTLSFAAITTLTLLYGLRKLIVVAGVFMLLILFYRVGHGSVSFTGHNANGYTMIALVMIMALASSGQQLANMIVFTKIYNRLFQRKEHVHHRNDEEENY